MKVSLTNVDTIIKVNDQVYRLYPIILTTDEYADAYQHFLEFIRIWHTRNTVNLLNPEQEYSDILMWIEYIKYDKIYTEEFCHILDQVYHDESTNTINNIELFNEFYGSLFLNFHPEFLNILQGKCYYMLKQVYEIDLNEIPTDIFTCYPWRWIIPYYNQSIPLESKKGLIRMDHLQKLSAT
jgi:hypothetical protein